MRVHILTALFLVLTACHSSDRSNLLDAASQENEIVFSEIVDCGAGSATLQWNAFAHSSFLSYQLWRQRIDFSNLNPVSRDRNLVFSTTDAFQTAFADTFEAVTDAVYSYNLLIEVTVMPTAQSTMNSVLQPVSKVWDWRNCVVSAPADDAMGKEIAILFTNLSSRSIFVDTGPTQRLLPVGGVLQTESRNADWTSMCLYEAQADGTMGDLILCRHFSAEGTHQWTFE